MYAIELFAVQGLAMSNASVTKGNERYPAEVISVKLLEAGIAPMQPYRIHLRSALGEMHLVNTRTVACLPIGVTNPWEVHAGTTPGRHSMMTFEEPVHWDWDGRQGIGWSERTYNPAPFPKRS